MMMTATFAVSQVYELGLSIPWIKKKFVRPKIEKQMINAIAILLIPGQYILFLYSNTIITKTGRLSKLMIELVLM